MTGEHLSAEAAAELLSRQQALQAEARHIIAELDLATIFGRAGEVYQVGSFISGLRVEQVFAVMLPLLTHPRMKMVRYRNDHAAFAPPDPTDERFFFALYYQPEDSEGGEEWKIDVSFWVSPLPRIEQAPAERIASRLDNETRLAILWIKDVWRHLPTYPYEIGGVDIYDAVLDHGVRTPTQFRAYLLARGKPA